MDRHMRVELGGVDITEYVTEITLENEPPPGIGIFTQAPAMGERTTRKFKIEVTPEFADAVQDMMRRAMPGTPYFWRSDPIPAPEPGVRRVADEFPRFFLNGTLPGAAGFFAAAQRDIAERRARNRERAQRYLEAIEPRSTPDIHGFEQDPDEQATLCRECGMWPDHHNHHREAGLRCVCADCRPTAQDLESDP